MGEKRRNELARKMKPIDAFVLGLYGNFVLRVFEDSDQDILETPEGQYYTILNVMEEGTIITDYTDLTLDEDGADIADLELTVGPITGLFKEVTISAGCISCAKLDPKHKIYEDNL